nr:hypothetical protein B0A51_16258 [Rachicladosporium sp. CCFEE 5018]OQO27473.1 hypothetical protein B0A51_06557 [Rachicladosporium sp. CCFEE 5018]
MCVAGLNVSTQSCSHRWYELIKPCRDDHNLANCPAKLRLEGWERRMDSCPWCNSTSEQGTLDSTHRLFGGSSSSSSSIASTPASPILGITREQRSDSAGSLGSLSLSRTSTAASVRSQINRDRDERFNMYLTMPPHELLPSASKYYPGTPREQSPTSPGVSSITGPRPSMSTNRSWRKSLSMARGMFGG